MLMRLATWRRPAVGATSSRTGDLACTAALYGIRATGALAGASHRSMTTTAAAAASAAAVAASGRVFTRTLGASPADAMDAHAVLSPKMRAWIASRGDPAVSAAVSAASNPPPLRPCPVDHLRSLVKPPSASLLTVVLPFGSDAAMRRMYINFRGQLRVGRLLEELDSFAGNVAYLHVDDGDERTEPPLLVTASTDRVDLLHYPLPADRDLVLSGCVSYVGQSSLNVDVDLMTRPTARDPTPTPLMQASLTFVARNRDNKAVAVPQLAPTTPFELALYEAGSRAQSERKAARSRSLSKLPPTMEELASVHALFQQLPSLTRRGASGELSFVDGNRHMFSEDTALELVLITMPQVRVRM